VTLALFAEIREKSISGACANKNSCRGGERLRAFSQRVSIRYTAKSHNPVLEMLFAVSHGVARPGFIIGGWCRYGASRGVVKGEGWWWRPGKSLGHCVTSRA
jgi:hypothetical protein